jgi:hypothetical protein
MSSCGWESRRKSHENEQHEDDPLAKKSEFNDRGCAETDHGAERARGQDLLLAVLGSSRLPKYCYRV